MNFTDIANAQTQDEYLTRTLLDDTSNSNVVLKNIFLPNCNKELYCEISTSNARPYLPKEYRHLAFKSLHELSHPGVRTTKKLIASKYFWNGMNRDITLWAKTYLQCQRAKVNRHTFSALQTFENSDRFEHIHVDIVGPLATSPAGHRYCVTIIDRRTRWPEAFPCNDISAQTVAKIIYENWICRYGSPVKLTSDQGRQFESNLFNELMKLLGIHMIHTTPYHTQSNGAVERWHRSLKAALSARLQSYDSSWVEQLPTVLLGLRAAGRSHTGISAAEMTFGRNLRLPGDFYDLSSARDNVTDSYNLVDKIRENISKLRSVESSHSNSQKFFIHSDLQKCNYVFVRDDTVRKPLKPPYVGPFRVIKRGTKVYVIQLPNKQMSISIDRLKPAYMLVDEDNNNVRPAPAGAAHVAPAGPSPPPPLPHNASLQSYKTRSGRVVKPSVRFNDYC